MSLIPFPNVPAYPGVPPLSGDLQALPLELLDSDGPGLDGLVTPPVWGIYKTVTSTTVSKETTTSTIVDPFTGEPTNITQTSLSQSTSKEMQLVLEPDSFLSFDFSKEYKVATFPLEGGSFANYNKVEAPYEQRVSMAKGGSDAERADFLTAVATAAASLDLYTVMTPDATYLNANIERYAYSRYNRNGVSLLQVDITLQQIRVAADLTFTNTASPSGASTQANGPVQAVAPTAAQSGALPAGGVQ